MDLTKEEIDWLEQAKQVFNVHTLKQVETTLRRKLTDKSWQAYVTSESRKLKSTKSPKEKPKPQFTFADVAKHAAKKDKGEIYGTKTMSSREIIGLYAHHGGLNLRPLHIGTFHTPTEDDSTPNPSLVLDI